MLSLCEAVTVTVEAGAYPVPVGKVIVAVDPEVLMIVNMCVLPVTGLEKVGDKEVELRGYCCHKPLDQLIAVPEDSVNTVTPPTPESDIVGSVSVALARFNVPVVPVRAAATWLAVAAPMLVPLVAYAKPVNEGVAAIVPLVVTGELAML